MNWKIENGEKNDTLIRFICTLYINVIFKSVADNLIKYIFEAFKFLLIL